MKEKFEYQSSRGTFRHSQKQRNLHKFKRKFFSTPIEIKPFTVRKLYHRSAKIKLISLIALSRQFIQPRIHRRQRINLDRI